MQLANQFQTRYKFYLDRIVPHVTARWCAWLGLVFLYGLRVFLLQGFYIITYALAIYNLNLVLGFVSPQIDPDLEGPTLPSQQEDEFRPFQRRLPEFKFWQSSFQAFLLATFLTLFPVFDVPVFWPILLIYFLVLFFMTMKRQIKHMIKYRYLPFSTGKKRYKGKGSASSAK